MGPDGQGIPGQPCLHHGPVALLPQGRGKLEEEEERTMTGRTMGHKASSQLSKTLTQSDSLSISSRKRCQTDPLARSAGEPLIPALSAHPSAGGGRSWPCSRCRGGWVLPPLG